MKSIERLPKEVVKTSLLVVLRKYVAIALKYMFYGDRGGSVKMRVGLNDLNGLSQP